MTLRMPLRRRCLHIEREAIAKRYAKRRAKKHARALVRHAKWKAR